MKILLAMAAAAAVCFAAPSVSAATDDFPNCSTGDEAKLTNPAFWDTAIQACTRLIAARSGKSKAASYADRASWLRRKKKYDEALADIDSALSLDPKNVEIYDAAADIWTEKGDFDRAIASYDQAIRIDPTYAAAYTSRGEAYLRKGNAESARASYNAALATPKTRAGDNNGLQPWAHRLAEKRLKELNEQKPANK